MSKPDQLPSIDPSRLGDVTGGTSDQVKQALEGILSTLDDLNSSSSNRGNSFLQWMPFFLLATGGGGFASGCSCGCGRRGCRGCGGRCR